MLMRNVSRNVLMRLGMFFLILGFVSFHFLRRFMAADMADGVIGLFYGLAIGLLIVSILAGRRRSSDNNPAA